MHRVTAHERSEIGGVCAGTISGHTNSVVNCQYTPAAFLQAICHDIEQALASGEQVLSILRGLDLAKFRSTSRQLVDHMDVFECLRTLPGLHKMYLVDLSPAIFFAVLWPTLCGKEAAPSDRQLSCEVDLSNQASRVRVAPCQRVVFSEHLTA